jgi:hypothetical protein
MAGGRLSEALDAFANSDVFEKSLQLQLRLRLSCFASECSLVDLAQLVSGGLQEE